jgi:uncharacterized protein YyaL (SSP411 family)
MAAVPILYFTQRLCGVFYNPKSEFQNPQCKLFSPLVLAVILSICYLFVLYLNVPDSLNNGAQVMRLVKVCIVFSLLTLVMNSAQPGEASMGNREKTVNKANRLQFEKSPYLLQHADNPVDWYPWGEEAFEKARKENKPIFLSIGYSTCHWCHVMAHESFEDPMVAQLMNSAFISIKVDREERPDIDKIYMTVCQMMTGSGGWPLTIIMTPEKKPFFAATYISKDNRFGRTGMIDLVPRIQEIWKTKHSEVLTTAQQIVASLRQTPANVSAEELTESTLATAYNQLDQRFDKQNGGFAEAPKFPTPHNLLFLLRYSKRSGNENALEMVEKTLRSMRQGGIYDQLGYGFHRYSTDTKWLVPHFEKMLYDQALLAMAYIETYQATEKKEYEKTAREIFSYVMRDMTAEEGGFYSAEDADSEGEEGKFYLWSQEEIQQILTEEETRIIFTVFNTTPEGNFTEEATGRKTGSNILHLTQSVAETASELNLTEQKVQTKLEGARQKLFAAREKRIHPHKDDKILVDWNGLMIAALAQGARVFDEPLYKHAAQRAVDFILKEMRKTDGRLLHRYRAKEAAITANLDDYAFFIGGLIELYETTFDVKYLQTALELNKAMITHFWDDTGGGFYFSPDDGEDLLVRQKEVYDGAIPSGNSVAMLNLLRLGRITTNVDFEKKAAQIGSTFARTLKEYPSAHTQLMLALDFAVGPSHEIVIVGNLQNQDTLQMAHNLRTLFVPNKVLLFRPSGQELPEISHIAEFSKNLTAIDGKATVYVCTNYMCKFPTTDLNKVYDLLNVKNPPGTKAQ